MAAEATYEGGPVAADHDAVAAVRALGDDAALAEALSLLHHVQLGPAYAHVRLEMATEIIRLGARADDPLLALMGLCWRTVDLFLLGDRRAGQSLQELRERAAAASCEAVGFIADVLVAVSIIAVVEPDLAAHLRASLVTGATCRYTPADPWVVTADR